MSSAGLLLTDTCEDCVQTGALESVPLLSTDMAYDEDMMLCNCGAQVKFHEISAAAVCLRRMHGKQAFAWACKNPNPTLKL